MGIRIALALTLLSIGCAHKKPVDPPKGAYLSVPPECTNITGVGCWLDSENHMHCKEFKARPSCTKVENQK